MKNKILFLLFFTIQSVSVFSQSVSTSPYSIFGLGSLYDSDFGSLPSIGSSGIALPSTTFINNKNPASLAFIHKNSFFFDIGLKGMQTTYSSQTSTEKRNNFQFSHLAIAFPLNSKSGISVSLKPYSSSNYLISNYKMAIGNSNESYYLNATSTGGLNNFDLSYGYKIQKKITFGLTTSFYFGNINDNKKFTIANSITNIDKKSYYDGIRFTLGNQVKIDSAFDIGLTIKTPSKLSASKIQSVTTANQSETQYVEENVNYSDITDYYLPLEIGVGFSKSFKKNINLTFDYEKSFWSDTNQSTVYGEFKNQDKFALGLSYLKQKQSTYYLDKIHYFTGVNYDTGYLLISNKNITNMSFSAGIGIPIDNTKSLLNITYSYGQKGTIGNGLIKENYHKIGINLSLESIWFVKQKFN
ncbi:MAG: aromatic hydrocarbon degradation protein [Flavobacterium sp.]|uniref:aromatic hydrocarbon degradation protein n=1 Tax=Flavobacterium sp. TaxID=239 RepID=UPI00260755B2|nr:aromatic hydrocarbon degradation protein [Flavobacterium sp.]MDD5149236.1 aromatic hydrocarbon degradation protein [Flavobacterium sp.]